ncbi:MAG: RNA-metabolising metallo-beta-lactamase [Candidatus Uhrbacteria bacterium GW2011_GWE2_40_58]|nr:MAG: RNA-metabolising metallo-beta-lactamase [Candidatus Uhrbacteria bacterium GW2011_GWF2_40_263]KKR67954.1 MAG: RNA-metabolising metallo-beta-lactamase [Candidatus Uhrbacteria bacterium GW2011_GWE2_40_58]OGL92400.1 MAG: hypothetical protein A2239_02130 [Candidatus Uhrbacteria bacterium RIFOXYA2_FULL_40_9]OGL96991.1 MAG: hypothetical protein A2332_03935 [Candidatus Uhrbacteria bacterium RIFOXYB2_FULL_41_18]HBK34771.1 MBL fold hydrolase [Candidatus Uhrbacteria bacterium]
MKLSFHGAARGVTGSCFLLKTKDQNGKDYQILIDCGMFQGARYADEANFEPFHFKVKEIDAVFITHAHADHTGRLPKLIAAGYKGPIYCTHPTRPLTRLVLEDSFHIMSENSRRNGDPLLYEQEDVAGVFEQCECVNYHEQITMGPGFTLMYHEAGHILGSAYISIETEGKRLVFSGDLGNNDVPILPDTEPLSQADYVVCESTYGHVLHEDPKGRTEILHQVIKETVEHKGVLLIPSFSIERTQEVLYEMDQIFEHTYHVKMPIFLDSPMAIRATELYRHYQQYLQFEANILEETDKDFFSFPNLHETLQTEESKAINDFPKPKVIIAGSGMMHGGRIMHHLIRYLPDTDCCLFIVGYQAEGTLGRQIFEGAKNVRIFGQEVKVQAQVKAIGAFSAHADQAKLTTWLQPIDGRLPKKIILVHGDPEPQQVFAAHLRHELRVEVVAPEFLEEIDL